MPLRRQLSTIDTHDVDPEDFVDFDAPDTADVLDQAEPDPIAIRAVPVEVQGPVRVEQPGARTGAPFTVQASVESGGVAVKVLNRDERRESATIVPLTADIYFGLSAGDVVNTPGAAVWPAGVPMVWRGTDELWAVGVTAATTITVVPELWAR